MKTLQSHFTHSAPPHTILLRSVNLTVLIKRRIAVISLLLVVTVLLLSVVALGTGGSSLGFGTIQEILRGEATEGQRLILFQWRIPRIFAGVAIGIALGISGAIFQTLTRNPLGSPDLIGFSMGAQTGILVSAIFFTASWASTAVFALCGGLVTGTLVYIMSFKGGFTGMRLILGGIAVSSMLGAFNRWLIVTVDADTAYGAMKAITGSLSNVGWDTAGWPLLGITLFSLVALSFSKPLELIALGDETSKSLGLPLQKVQTSLVFTAVVLVALATVTAGPISFVALLAPHVARSLCRSYIAPLAASGLTGALLLLGADVLGQSLLDSLPVGVITSAVGGLYFLSLLMMETRKKL